MARADERRVTVRLSHEEFESLERACRVAGVPLGAMCRVCALNWCAFVAAEMATGREFGFTRGVNRVRAVSGLVEKR